MHQIPSFSPQAEFYLIPVIRKGKDKTKVKYPIFGIVRTSFNTESVKKRINLWACFFSGDDIEIYIKNETGSLFIFVIDACCL
jgi:hypothetical protein